MTRNLFLTLCIILVSLTVGDGQRFRSINDKYPFARANVTYQDDYGFIWFGTREGLIKYDGYSTTEYKKKPGIPTSLPGTQVKSILQVSDSLLFIGFDRFGLGEFNRNNGISKIIHLNEDLDNLHVNSLIKDHAGSIWVGTNEGLFKIDDYPGNNVSKVYSEREGLLSRNVLELYEDGSKNLWIGTDQGIHLLPDGKEIIENPMTNPGFPKEEVINIQEDNDGELWVSLRHGSCKLYKWDPRKKEFTQDQRFIRDGEFSFAFDEKNHIWASSHGRGVYHFKEDEEIFYSDKHYSWHGLRAMFTYSVYHDKYHNTWVESDEVFKMPGSNKEFYSIESDKFQVISVYADDDYIWYCSNEPHRWSRKEKQSVAYLENVDFTELINPDRERKHKRIYDYKEWGDSVVFTSIRNIYIWDRLSGTFKEYPTILEGAFREFIIDNTNHIWIPGDEGAPTKMDLISGQVTKYRELTNKGHAVTVDQSPQGVQWWGTRDNGLFSYNPKTKVTKQYIPDPSDPNESINSFSINDIMVHPDGSVWVATKLGLNRIDPESNVITQFSFEKNILNTNITSLIADDEGTLWLGTENGLVHFDQFENETRHFTIEDGIINTNFSERVCYKDKNGWLYFGGDNGIDFFHPDKIGLNSIEPDIYIKDVKVNGNNYDESLAGELLHSIELPYNQNFLEVEIVGLHYVASEAQEYMYRLPLQSDDWNTLGNNRVISLARLSAGTYNLEVKCANPDGIWSQPKQLLQIRINPPFWQTYWFIGLMALLTGLGVYLIYLSRIKQIKNVEIQNTEFNKRIAEIEMKALRAQMNPHFLFNSLNSIRLLVDKGDNTAAKNYLTIYSQLIRQVLNNSTSKFIKIDREIKVLRHYLDLERMRFKNFDYSISIEDDLETDFLEIPPLLMQPYVENAIWHGLMHKEHGERNLDIRISKEKDFVVFEIEDNGIGRKKSKSINSKIKKTKESLGLKISEDRIKFLKDIYGKDASVRIIDLENPSGTKVVIRLPIYN